MEIVGIGNALMDVIAFVDEDFAPSRGFHNNATVHLDRARLDAVLAGLPEAVFAAGGGAANTVRAAALLGLKASFSGSVGEDELGLRYRGELEAAGVEPLLSASPAPTGVYCALVRPDGGRSLLVAPSAALDLVLEPPPQAMFKAGAILYLEGFLLRDRAFFMACLEGGRRAGMKIALDLGSFSLVRAQRDFLLELLPDYVDYLFANEDEFSALAELPFGEAVELLADAGPAIVVKLAERGAVYARGGERIESPVRALRPVDETGAGDAFAAGFLAGIARGYAPERCLRLGNRIAEEVLGVPGLAVDSERLKAAWESVSA